jgi:hypothetical protein
VRGSGKKSQNRISRMEIGRGTCIYFQGTPTGCINMLFNIQAHGHHSRITCFFLEQFYAQTHLHAGQHKPGVLVARLIKKPPDIPIDLDLLWLIPSYSTLLLYSLCPFTQVSDTLDNDFGTATQEFLLKEEMDKGNDETG